MNTGSIYYNLEKTNNSGSADDEPIEFNLNTYEEILANPMNWQVGVARFKVPVQGVDLFRIYPKRYYVGATMSSTTPIEGFTTIKPNRTGNTGHQIRDLFSYDSVNAIDFEYKESVNTINTTNTTINGVVVPTNTASLNKQLRNKGYYMKVASHEKFISILNRKVLDSLNGNSGMEENLISEFYPENNIVANTASENFKKGSIATNFIVETAGWTGINSMASRWTDDGATPPTEYYFNVFGKGASNTGQAAGNAFYPKQGGVDTSDMNVKCPVWLNMPIQQNGTPTAEDFTGTAITNQNFKGEGVNGFNTLGVVSSWQFRCRDIIIDAIHKDNVLQDIDPDISNIKFYLAHRRGANASHTDNSNWDRMDITPNWSGFKVSEFRDYYPNGFKVSGTGNIPLQKGQHYLEGSNLTDIKNSNTYFPNYCVDNNFDFQMFLGQSVMNKASANAGCRVFMLEVEVSGKPDESVRFLMRKNGNNEGAYLWQLNVNVNCNPTFTNDGLNNKTSYGSYVFPRYIYDPSSKMISYRNERFWFNRNFKIFMNKSLQSLLGFKYESPIETFNEYLKTFLSPLDELLKYANPSSITICGEEFTEELYQRIKGGYMNTNDADATPLLSGEGDDGRLTSIETESSAYKRRFLYGITIVSSSIPNAGEYIGATTKRKVLTDFVIDPSTNGEDYLIYEPEGGGSRYYPLNTNLPLRDLVVSILYTDMNLNTRLLPLPANYTTTLKMEFRPNNMLLNYEPN